MAVPLNSGVGSKESPKDGVGASADPSWHEVLVWTVN